MSLRPLVASFLVVLAACAAPDRPVEPSEQPSDGRLAVVPDAAWAMNATIIEACSCTMFCPCYFGTKPSGPGCCANPDDPLLAQRFCRFNNAYRVNHGYHQTTRLDGVRFWLAGDLGADFGEGRTKWAVVHFDPSVSQPQREGVLAILPHVYPAKWEEFGVGPDARIAWEATRDRAVALLDAGKMGEVVLRRNQGMTDAPIVIHNLRYWGAPRNDGFVLMQNEVEAYRAPQRAFEFRGTNGFLITFDIHANDVAPKASTKTVAR